jgi:hypothetical protein
VGAGLRFAVDEDGNITDLDPGAGSRSTDPAVNAEAAAQRARERQQVQGLVDEARRLGDMARSAAWGSLSGLYVPSLNPSLSLETAEAWARGALLPGAAGAPSFASAAESQPPLTLDGLRQWLEEHFGKSGFVDGFMAAAQGDLDVVNLLLQAVSSPETRERLLGALKGLIGNPEQLLGVLKDAAGSLVDWEDLSHFRFDRAAGYMSYQLLMLLIPGGAAAKGLKLGAHEAEELAAKTGLQTLKKGGESAVIKEGGESAADGGRLFVSTAKGHTVPVPRDWSSRVADNGNGLVYQRPGARETPTWCASWTQSALPGRLRSLLQPLRPTTGCSRQYC